MVGRVLGRAAIERSVAGFFLRELDGIDARAIRLLEEEEVAALVDDTDRNLHVSLFRFRFGGRNHGFDGCKIQPLLAGEIRAGCQRQKSNEQRNCFGHDASVVASSGL